MGQYEKETDQELDIDQSKISSSQQLDILKILLRKKTIEEVISVLDQQINMPGNFDGYLVSMLDEQKHSLICQKVSLIEEFSDIEKTYTGYSIDKKIFDEDLAVVKQYGNIISKENISFYSDELSQRFERWKMSVLLFLPIETDEKVIGQLLVFKQSGEFSEQQALYYKELIELFSYALLKSYEYSTLEKREEHVESLEKEKEEFLDFIANVNRLSSLGQIYDMITIEFLNRFPFNLAGIYVAEEKNLEVKAITTLDDRYQKNRQDVYDYWKQNPYTLKKEDGAPVIALMNNSKVFVQDVQKIKHMPMSVKDKGSIPYFGTVRTVLHMPIRKWDMATGILSLWSLDEEVNISEEDLAFIEQLSSYIGIAISNAELFSLVEGQKEEITHTLDELEKTKDKLLETERNKAAVLKVARDTAEASARSKSEFLANMSHEIRTPMNAIIGLVGLALKTHLTSKQKDYLEKIDKSSRSLLEIINDILDFSKIEAGKLNINESPIDIEEILYGVQEMFLNRAAEGGIALLVDFDRQIPNNLLGDQLRVNQVLINLVGNAIKFTSRGEVSIAAKIEEIVDENIIIRFDVTDTGIGIHENIIPQLFDAFTQADGSTTRKFGGTGLGLSICKSLVEMMDGQIWAESELGKGSIFSFTIKFTLDDNHVAVEEDESHPQIFFGKNAIVLDETGEKGEKLEALQEFAIRTEVYSDWNDIFEALNSRPKYYDIFICDINNAEVNGIEMLRRILSMEIFAPSRIVLIISSGGEEDIRIRACEMGLDQLVVSPFDKEELKQVVSRSLGRDYVIEKLSANESNEGNIKSIRGAHILLVEDNDINKQVAVEILESEALKVDVAINGLEAIAAVKRKNYDAVLMDMQMPEMGGCEATEIIREQPDSTSLPIIAMTANVMQQDKEKCLNSGMNDFIPKPIDPNELFQKLVKWIDPAGFEGDISSDAKEQDVSIGLKSQSIPPNDTVAEDNYEDNKERRLQVLEPVIDVSDALPKMLGNEELFISLLQEFETEHSEAYRVIMDSFNEKDFDKSSRVAHTVKGLAGTFSASNLQNAARDLEFLIEEDPESSGIKDKMEAFKIELELVLSVIRKL